MAPGLVVPPRCTTPSDILDITYQPMTWCKTCMAAPRSPSFSSQLAAEGVWSLWHPPHPKPGRPQASPLSGASACDKEVHEHRLFPPHHQIVHKSQQGTSRMVTGGGTAMQQGAPQVTSWPCWDTDQWALC